MLGAALALVLAVWTDLDALLAALGRFPLLLLPLVLLLTVGNQALRFVRWELMLDEVDVDLPTSTSARIFTSGLAMILTPGKLGEVWKGWLVQDTEGTPLEHTIPVVGIERLTDVLGVLALSFLGVLAFGASPWLWGGLTAALLALVLLLQRDAWVLALLSRIEALPVVGTLARRSRAFYRPTRALLEPRPLLAALGLSIAGWSLECLGTWIVLQGLGVDVSLAFAAFVFAAASILGAISMLPGGLGLTEASMIGLLVHHGVGAETATAATLLVRLATLWFVAATALTVWGTHRARSTVLEPGPSGGSA